MALIGGLKNFYKRWIEPAGVREWRTRPADATSQKFWTGTPVPAPPRERGYFDALRLESATITRRDDSRHCALVRGEVSLPIERAGPGGSVQVAVTADQWPRDAAIRFTAESSSVRHVALQPGRWLDVRLPVRPDATALRIQTDHPVWVSYPRVKRERALGDAPAVRHVVVMVMDGLSRRLLASAHPTDPGRGVTPNLDRFFANGFHAENAFSSSDWTLPTTASFFSGLYASRHGMVHPTLPMQHRTDRKLLAEFFQDAGYHTLALSTGNRLTPAFGSHRGFDRFIYHWPYEGRTAFDYDPAVWVNEMHGHLDLHRSDATFTYVHFPDSHPAWNLPPLTRAFNLGRRGDSTGHDLDLLERTPLGREQGRQVLLLRLYELDRTLGGLLDYIDAELGRHAVVVLTADHGTPWPDFLDTEPKDRPSLNEFRTGTFLRMRGGGIAPERRSELVSPNLDLMPTLLRLAGIAAPADLDGRDLFDGGAPRTHLVAESLYRDVCEIAVSSADRQWIEKYRMDERTHRIDTPPFYRAAFARGCTDYTRPPESGDDAFERIVAEHLTKAGLRGG